MPATWKGCATPLCTQKRFHLGPHSFECPQPKRGIQKRQNVTSTLAKTAAIPFKESQFDSVSKKTQRFRIACDLTSAAAAGVVPPRLFLVGAPDKMDVRHLKSMAPPSTVFVSVNRDSFASDARAIANATFVENVEAEAYLQSARPGQFSHIWLDLMERQATMKLIFLARRALDNSNTDCLYVSLSTRAQTPSNCEMVLATQLGAVGGHVTHSEFYKGCNSVGELSVKRNMLFVAAHFTATVPKWISDFGYNENMNPVGALAWVKSPKKLTDIVKHTFRGNVQTYMGVITNLIADMYTVQFFDTKGHLTETKIKVPANPQHVVKVAEMCAKKLGK